MKTHTTITDLTHEDLVDLLCTATYGSSWLEIYCSESEAPDASRGDCREDVWAKALLAGKKIACIDHYAEGEVYGDLGRVDESEDGIYLIDLERIRLGLADAIDGTFPCDDDIKSWAQECAQHFIDGKGEMDEPEAACLMQIIMFGEVIY